MRLSERIGNVRFGVITHKGVAYLCFNGVTARNILKGHKLVM